MAGVTVLMYHHVSPNPGAFTVSPSFFYQHVKWLSQSGYKVLTGNELSHLKREKKGPRQPAVMLTFDDGWLDNWIYALPILKAFGIPATWFVVTGWVGVGEPRFLYNGLNPDSPNHTKAMVMASDPSERDSVMMRWSELLASRDSGLIQIENHSHTHGQWWSQKNWCQIKKAFVNDLEQSRSTLRAKTGEVPTQFCWPKGKTCQTLANIASDQGYEVQHSVLRGNNSTEDSALIRRLNVENEGVEWLKRRLRFYNIPGIGSKIGELHGWIHGQRMYRRFQGHIPSQEFRSLGNANFLAKS